MVYTYGGVELSRAELACAGLGPKWIDYPEYDRSLMQQTCDALRHKIVDGKNVDKLLTNC